MDAAFFYFSTPHFFDMATGVPHPPENLREWINTLPNRHITTKWPNGFSDHKPFKDYLSEHMGNAVLHTLVTAAPLMSGMWATNWLASRHGSYSKPIKALNMMGLALIGSVTTLSAMQLSLIATSFLGRGRVLVINTEGRSRYIKSIWPEDGSLNWEITTMEYEPGVGMNLSKTNE